MPKESPITEHWPAISHAYLTAPSVHGIIPKLAKEYGVSPNTLRQRIWQSGLRDEREKLRNNLPVKKLLREKAAEAIAEAVVDTRIKPFSEAAKEKFEKHLERMVSHQDKLHDDLERFAEAEPYEFGVRLGALDKLDQLARRTFGISQDEGVSPDKRGIAFLISGYEPKPVQGRVVE